MSDNKTKTQWEIPPRSRRCCKGQEPFEPGGTYWSVLSVSEDGRHYLRSDFCMACWRQEPPTSNTHWEGRVAKRSDRPDYRTKLLDSVVDVLRSTLKSDDPDRHAIACALVWVLGRLGKDSIITMIREEGQQRAIFEMDETGELFTIPIIEFTPELWQRVEPRVVQLLPCLAQV